MKRAFASLNPQEALRVAIFIEERNAELYHRFAEMFVEFRDEESLEIASVFRDMAVEEKHHSTLLQGQYLDRFGSSSCALTEEDLVDLIEVPKLDTGSILAEAGEGRQGSARERALEVALSAEVGAHRFYEELVKSMPDGPLHRLYRELAEMEDGHVAYIQRKLVPHTSNDRNVH